MNKTVKKIFSAERNKKISIANTGKKHSEETKKKLREINLGRKNPHSDIAKMHMREAAKRKPKMSDETKKKISESKKGRNTRDKHWNWQGGKSFLPYPIDWIDSLKNSIRERDNLSCQMCGLHQDELNGFHKKLAVHHIDYDKNNLNPNNLITLCNSCHQKTNFNRQYWIKYFKQ